MGVGDRRSNSSQINSTIGLGTGSTSREPMAGALSVDARNGLIGDTEDVGDIKTVLDMNCDIYGPMIIDDSDDLSSSTTTDEESAGADDAEFE
jgi:hypothetical protein